MKQNDECDTSMRLDLLSVTLAHLMCDRKVSYELKWRWLRDVFHVSVHRRSDMFHPLLLRHQAILSSKAEGDSKVDDLRRQSESLCEQEDLEKSRKQEVQQSLRQTEEQWRTSLQTAEECLRDTQVLSSDQDVPTQVSSKCASQGEVHGGWKCSHGLIEAWFERIEARPPKAACAPLRPLRAPNLTETQSSRI